MVGMEWFHNNAADDVDDLAAAAAADLADQRKQSQLMQYASMPHDSVSEFFGRAIVIRID